MTDEEAKNMLKAKLECLKHETSGTDYACNLHLCEDCSLNYEQGNMGEQEEALQMGAKALELISHLKRRPCEACEFYTEKGCSKWECVFEGSDTE